MEKATNSAPDPVKQQNLDTIDLNLNTNKVTNNYGSGHLLETTKQISRKIHELGHKSIYPHIADEPTFTSESGNNVTQKSEREIQNSRGSIIVNIAIVLGLILIAAGVGLMIYLGFFSS